MSITVVSSGHGHSTYDVFTGLCAGLRACGVTVHEFPLHTTLETMELLVGAAKMMELSPPGGYPDPVVMASATIPGFVMAKRTPWVVFVHGLNVPATIPATLRRGGYKTAVLLTESPYQLDEERLCAAPYDVVLTTERNAVGMFGRSHVYHLPHAWNPEVHTPEGERAPACDVFFCGTRYPERDALLNGVDWTGIDVVDKSITYERGEAPKDLSFLDNATVATYYRSARISLNHHRQIAHPVHGGTIEAGLAHSLNPRAYEVPACGGFLISDARAELDDVFAGSVPTFTDSASLEGMLRYYLTHEDERRGFAARQFAAVQRHSWTVRADQLLGILAEHSATVASRAA